VFEVDQQHQWLWERFVMLQMLQHIIRALASHVVNGRFKKYVTTVDISFLINLQISILLYSYTIKYTMYVQFLTYNYVSDFQLDENKLMYNEIFKWDKKYKNVHSITGWL